MRSKKVRRRSPLKRSKKRSKRTSRRPLRARSATMRRSKNRARSTSRARANFREFVHPIGSSVDINHHKYKVKLKTYTDKKSGITTYTRVLV